MENILKLHRKKDDFTAAIQIAAKHFKIREVFIEKDYWVSYVLKNLANSRYSERVVFKGGTSLSKAYRIAERFSEDIDLAIISNSKSSQSALDKMIVAVEKEIALNPLKIDKKLSFTSRNKKFRQSHWKYPRHVAGKHDPAKDKIMLEITSSAVTDPNAYQTVRSLIAEYLMKNGQPDMIKEFELEEFEIRVLSHERTFSEKIVAITNACFADDDLTKMKEKIRHLYDITLLLRDPKIKKFVKSKAFVKMIFDARRGDKNIPGLEVHFKKPWQSAAVFNDPKKSLTKLSSTNKSQLAPLVFDKTKMPTLNEIENALKFIVNQVKSS